MFHVTHVSLHRARLFVFLRFRHALLLHLFVLMDEPETQGRAQDDNEHAHGERDPHAFAVEGLFGRREDVGTC